MTRKDKKIIKKLAIESLKDKWYPLREGNCTTNIGDSCSFCVNTKEKRKIIKRKTEEDHCAICYIEMLVPNFCYDLGGRGIDEVIEVLEKLAKYGKLKDE